MKFKNVLLLYKRSAYRIYFLDENSSLRGKKSLFLREEKKRFEDAHVEHYKTLKNVAKILLTHGIRFTESYRGRSLDYSKYDFIITVGGDGTFLEAARHSKHQVILGINSAPGHSVGRFCIANNQNFQAILKKIILGKFKIGLLQRLRLSFEGKVQKVEALNDILICHSNPAVLCRYYVTLNGKREEQRSSGVWISTPAGSSGAIHSAGGKLMNQYLKQMQYRPRELYQGHHKTYKLRGGILGFSDSITLTSLMRQGMIYVDGAHHKFPFEYACNVQISLSPHPIRTIRI